MKDRTITAVIIGDGTKDFAKSLTTARMQVDWVDNAGFRLFECCIYQRFGKPGAWWGTRFRVDSEFILLFLKGSRPGFFDKQHLMIPSKHAGKTWSGSDRRTDGTTIPVVDAPINDLKCRGTIWPYATSNSEGNRTKMKHPATFPDLLASDLIRCFCPPGGTTLDPLCGSGTTLVQAAKNGRDFLGIEINPEYVRIAEERLRTEAGVDLSEYCR
jgi:site-specific DNA-methyltransferase (adenine-specific)